MTQEKKTTLEPRTSPYQDKSSKVQRQSPYSNSIGYPSNKGQKKPTAIFDNVNPVRSVAYDHFPPELRKKSKGS